ncbi:unnamed protein product [Protopolystoma xenopodis]|uniref:Uncharacterized protein n=1 Tax=Protopolystoma xenopodis TaxID=117903 RepID=A0A448XL33_9PLAT|nr:unnamed protein product [Protopolystoma xenopodis]
MTKLRKQGPITSIKTQTLEAQWSRRIHSACLPRSVCLGQAVASESVVQDTCSQSDSQPGSGRLSTTYALPPAIDRRRSTADRRPPTAKS